MKKFISMALVLATGITLATGSSAVLASDNTATASTPTEKDSAANTQNFEEHKARILKHINERLTKIQDIQSCVQAANDDEALRACRPHNGKKHGDKKHSN